ncbi:MAG: VOC family protein [Patescibacteria group bacterium]|nr:VOC family protein [Patescibacteria group bacterium]MDE2590778.1 VOC family protein [Patescibacteria group bacterium]
MKILRYDDVCIWSENPDKLAEFYEKLLELPVVERIDIPDDKGILFDVAGVYLFIGFHDRVHGKASDPYRVMPGFVVEDVYKTYDELKEKGVKFIKPACISPDGKYHVATAVDPEGNIIQFFSY